MNWTPHPLPDDRYRGTRYADTRIDPYATFLPALVHALGRMPGPVLEIGCGRFSTPILHLLCGDRRVVSLEHSAIWHSRFAELASDTHEICLVDDWATCELIDQPWAVALVDHEPRDRRGPDLERLRRAGTKICVVHDAEDGNYFGPFFDAWTHVRIDKMLYPWTALCSMTDSLKEPE